jgi:osmotically inducible protein OsmC
MPYSFKSRFKNDDGTLGTNPEELIASALAGCFNMKLSFVLNDAGFNPESLKTDAVLTFEEGVVTNIALILKAKVADITTEKFAILANEAKENCPISAVLNCNITLEASLG